MNSVTTLQYAIADKPGAPNARAGWPGSVRTRRPLAIPPLGRGRTGRDRGDRCSGAQHERQSEGRHEPDECQVHELVVRTACGGVHAGASNGVTVRELIPRSTSPPRVAASSAGGRLSDGVAVGVGVLAYDDVRQRDLLARLEPGTSERRS